MRAPILSTLCAPRKPQISKRVRPNRSLRLESLERRWVFSAAPVAEATDAGACLPEAAVLPVDTGDFASAVPVGPTYPALPSGNTALIPPSTLPVDQLFAELDSAEGENDSYYLHIEMSATAMGGRVWNFAGKVTVTGEVGNVIVRFGGLLEGHTTSVDAYGLFSYSHQFAFGSVGQVTGQAEGSLGAESNIETEFIWT